MNTNTSRDTLSSEHHLPISQESLASTATDSTGTVPRLLSSLSNISNSTGGDTALTSPTSSSNDSSQQPRSELLHSPSKTKPQPVPRLETAFNYRETQAPVSASTAAGGESNGSGNSSATPMSADMSGLVQGSKRTASGAIKNGMVGQNSQHVERSNGIRYGGHTRNLSLESNGTRSSELAAQLKTRLSYAMVKVQHGWERQSIDELEEQTSQVGSPVTARNGDLLRHSDSPQSISRRRRLSSYSENSDKYLFSPGYEASPRGISRSLNATPSVYTYNSAQPAPVHRAFLALNDATHKLSATYQQDAVLAPAAQLTSPRSARSRRSHTTNVPPELYSATKSHSDLGPGNLPRTPRQGILRMPSQQAEKDAVDTLLFMSSPNHSARLGQTVAMNDMAGPKRVAFEAREDGSRR